jgi:hypothetical protein
MAISEHSGLGRLGSDAVCAGPGMELAGPGRAHAQGYVSGCQRFSSSTLVRSLARGRESLSSGQLGLAQPQAPAATSQLLLSAGRAATPPGPSPILHPNYPYTLTSTRAGVPQLNALFGQTRAANPQNVVPFAQLIE